MGIIDQFQFHIECPSCSSSEKTKVLQHGSQYGASWGEPTAVDNFDVDWTHDQFGNPYIRGATCRNCGSQAHIT